MSIFNEIKDFLVKNCRTREAAKPTETQGVILYDENGAERLVLKSIARRQNEFALASVADFTAFVKDIPARYPADTKAYRELVVEVNSKDIPTAVSITLPFDDPREAYARFAFVEHEDFTRWFDGKQRSQTEFRRLLIELEDQHDLQNLAKALTFLEYKTEVTFEASAETERNYVLAYREKDGKSGLNIPKVINVKCPVISGAAYMVETTFDIVIRKPRQDDPRILFSLSPALKEPVKIMRDAATVVAEHELLLPSIEFLKANGVTPVSPIYVRGRIQDTVWHPEQAVFTL